MSSFAFLIPYTIIFPTLSMGFYNMPESVLLSKIVPKGIEGTLGALLIGINNLSKVTLANLYGAWINDEFFGLTKEKLIEEGKVEHGLKDKTYIKLHIVKLVIGLFVIPTLLLVPLRKTIEKFQKE